MRSASSLALPLAESSPIRLGGLVHLPESRGVRVDSLRARARFGDCFVRQFGRLVEGPVPERDVRIATALSSHSREVIEALGGDAAETHLATLAYFLHNAEVRKSLKVDSLFFRLRDLDQKLCTVALISMGQDFGLVAYENHHNQIIRRGGLLVVPAHHLQPALFL